MRTVRNSSRLFIGRALNAQHAGMRGGDPSRWGGTPGPLENPAVTLDPQNRFHADTFFEQSVKRPDLLFPWAHFPWMTIAGPQLKQAPSVHNIWNATPPLVVRILPSALINHQRSNRIRSVFSFGIKLPSTGASALGGTS